jgi:hypothetical protein
LSQAPVDALTRDLPLETRGLLSELTSLVENTVPEATHKVNLGWKSLSFSHPIVGYFCGLFPVQDRVIVAFEFGVLLPDPGGILDDRGCAKQVRYLPIRSRSRIPRTALKRLLRAAVALPGDRATRIALARSGARPAAQKPNGRKRAAS